MTTTTDTVEARVRAIADELDLLAAELDLGDTAYRCHACGAHRRENFEQHVAVGLLRSASVRVQKAALALEKGGRG